MREKARPGNKRKKKGVGERRKERKEGTGKLMNKSE